MRLCLLYSGKYGGSYKIVTESGKFMISFDLSSMHLKSGPNRYGRVCHKLEAASGKIQCHLWKGHQGKCAKNWSSRVRLPGTLYNPGQCGVFGI